MRLWSNELPDERFAQLLDAVFESSEAHVVTFPNPSSGAPSSSTVSREGQILEAPAIARILLDRATLGRIFARGLSRLCLRHSIVVGQEILGIADGGEQVAT